MSEAQTELGHVMRKHRASTAFPGNCDQCWDKPFPCPELQAARLALAAPLLKEALEAFTAYHRLPDSEVLPCTNVDCHACWLVVKAEAALAAARGEGA